MTLIIKDIFSLLKWRMAAFFGLSIVRAAGEGFRLSMILLLLPFLGVETSTPMDSIVGTALNWAEIPYTIYTVSAAICLAFLLQSAINIVYTWYSAGYTNYFVFVWRIRLSKALVKARWRFFVDLQSGKLQNAISQECSRLGSIVGSLFECASGVVIVIGYLLVALSTNTFASLVVIAFSSVVVVLDRCFSRPILQRSREFSQYNHKMLRAATEHVHHMKTIKAMARGGGVLSELRNSFHNIMKNQRITSMLTTIYRQSIEVVFGVVLILTAITILSISPESKNAGLVPVLIISVRALSQANNVLMSLQRVNVSRGAYEFVRDLWHEALQISEESDWGRASFGPSNLRDRISFRDISVRYPRGVGLDGVNADVVFGQFTAIVGPSGAGKTTFVDTLLRLHEPRTGEIRVDGRPLSDFSVSSWRQNIGYVSQDSALVDATIADNIRFGIPEAPFADVEEAARRAGADEFIRKMPAGYDTRVGDRGVQLSGGQRQRIALASALLPNPPILILDEATSALDSRLEADIMQNIVRMRGSHAIIVIAHRLSTVTNADRIYVFDEGRVVESGTWSSLIERGNLFAEMWHLQRGGKDWGGI